MKLLVTGSSGYLGQHFVKALVQKYSLNSDDVNIYITYGSSEGFEGAVKSSVEEGNIHIHKLEFTNEDEVDSYLKANGPFQICFHLAAISSPKSCEQNKEKCIKVNVPTYFFEALKDTCIVALSTDQVYCGEKAPYLESDEAGPKNAYAQSKRDMESLLLNQNNDKRSKPAVCLRSSIICGPLAPYGDAHSTFLHFCQSRKGVETTFFTDEIRSIISVQDVVNILLFFCDQVKSGNHFPSGIYNMGGKDFCSRMDMATAVADYCAFSNDVFIPAEKAKLELGPNDVPSPLDISMNSSKLEKLVGWNFGGLDDIVKQALE